MKLFEYQAKELFAEMGIPVPAGQIVTDADAVSAAVAVSGLPCVLKSQVLRGGRGKAGLIQFAETVADAKAKAQALFDGPHGVRKILIEQALDIGQELYLAITVDPLSGKALVMGSAEGGIDIEELAVHAPEKIVRQSVDITQGILPFQLRAVLFGLGLKGDAFKQGMKILKALFGLFCAKDAELVEINPLIVTTDGQLVAADGKFSIDDNAAFRQEGLARTREQFDSALEFEAAEAGFPYLKFDGEIGLMCAGAGLTNTVYDLIIDYGGTVANYLEFGGPNYRRAIEAMEFTLRGKPKVILIVTFGTIARADVMVEGIAAAIEKLKPDIPIVTAIRGTNEVQAAEMLKKLGLEPLRNTEEAVQKAIALCRGGNQ
ncbi:MAG: acetate--CoA ligase family protein [Lentisphaeria bacterium]|nr:acetate--CoA ligase family protein [Lentisphaeria bacterium]